MESMNSESVHGKEQQQMHSWNRQVMLNGLRMPCIHQAVYALLTYGLFAMFVLAISFMNKDTYGRKG